MRTFLALVLLSACSATEPKYTTWDLPEPVVWRVHKVEVCDNAPLNVDEVADHLTWWYCLDTDYDWVTVYPSSCTHPVGDNTIRIQAANVFKLIELGANGYTQYEQKQVLEEVTPGNWYETTVRYNATVNLPPFPSTDLVLHELGHAWGWSHPWGDIPGHLMSPVAGEAIDGLEIYGREENEPH